MVTDVAMLLQHDVQGRAGVEVKLRILRLSNFSTSQPGFCTPEQHMMEVVRPTDGVDGRSVWTLEMGGSRRPSVGRVFHTDRFEGGWVGPQIFSTR